MKRLYCNKNILSNFLAQKIEDRKNFFETPNQEALHFIELPNKTVHSELILFSEVVFWGYPSQEASYKSSHFELLPYKIKISNITSWEFEQEVFGLDYYENNTFKYLLSGLIYTYTWGHKFGLGNKVKSYIDSIYAPSSSFASYVSVFSEAGDYPIEEAPDIKKRMFDSDNRKYLRFIYREFRLNVEEKQKLSEILSKIEIFDFNLMPSNLSRDLNLLIGAGLAFSALRNQTPLHKWMEREKFSLADESLLFALFIFGLKYSPALYYGIIPSLEKDFLSLETFALSVALGQDKKLKVKKFDLYEDELPSLETKNKRFFEYYSALVNGNKRINFLPVSSFPQKRKEIFWTYEKVEELERFWVSPTFKEIQVAKKKLEKDQFSWFGSFSENTEIELKKVYDPIALKGKKTAVVLVNGDFSFLNHVLQQVAKNKSMERVLLVVPPIFPTEVIRDENYKVEDWMALAENLMRKFSMKAKNSIYFDIFKINESDPYEVIRFGRKFMVNQKLENGLVIIPTDYQNNLNLMERLTRVYPNVAAFDGNMEYLFFNLS